MSYTLNNGHWRVLYVHFTVYVRIFKHLKCSSEKLTILSYGTLELNERYMPHFRHSLSVIKHTATKTEIPTQIIKFETKYEISFQIFQRIKPVTN